MKTKLLSMAVLILTICITGIFSGCTSAQDGAMPQFTIGDKWISRWVTEGKEYIVTAQIAGEEIINGKDCWVIETTFDPAYADTVKGTTNKYEKVTLDILSSEYHNVEEGTITTFDYQISGTPYYPLKVGKEAEEVSFQVVNTGDEMVMQTQNMTIVTRTKVEKMETITTEAGTFKCFKVLKYDEYGILIQTTWRSDEVKLWQVKMIDESEPDATYELISYSVN